MNYKLDNIVFYMNNMVPKKQHESTIYSNWKKIAIMIFTIGVEMWNNNITSKRDNNNYAYKDYVATAGLGYIFKVYKNFYVKPWGAVHYVLNNELVSVSDTEYQTKKFQGEISLKIGWHF